MKKLSLGLSVVFFSMTATMSVASTDKDVSELTSLGQGAYIGGELGYDAATISNQFLYNFTTSHGPSTQVGSTHLATSGFVGGGFIGYGLRFPKSLYLALEIGANGSTASTANETIYNHYHDIGLYDHDGYSNDVSLRSNYAISVLPGVQIIPNLLLYGRLGYSQAQLSGNETVIFYGEPFGVPTSYTPSAISFSTQGFSYGLGLEMAVFKQVSLRVDFIHTDYQSKTTQLNNQVSLSDNQMMIGLLYRFS